MLKKVVVALVFLVALLGGALLYLRASLSHDLPHATVSWDADALAKSMQEAVHHEAWLETDVVRWTFRGVHTHVWDRSRGFTLVVWEDGEPGNLVEVWLRLDDQQGVVHRKGLELTGSEAEDYLEQAWAIWCNDSFWLNPIAKLFDPGTSRGLVELEGGHRGLLVSYSEGGVTPGDAYLWILGEDGRPTAWRMWTDIVPIDGLEISWEGWVELETGAVVATRHRTPLGMLEITGVGVGPWAAPDRTDDRFAPLVEKLVDL